MPNKILLIDGHALIFKTYYAFLSKPLINSKGEDTSIIYGFLKTIFELIQKEEPSHIAVVFDPPGGSFRNSLYPEYKANRAETPQAIKDCMEPLRKLCNALNIANLMEIGFEADDLIGSIAKQFADENNKVYMITPDKDYGQLVDNNIYMYKPPIAKKDWQLYDTQAICEKYGIKSTSQIIDYLAICGDSADNIPGVKGVGPLTAAKLLQKYDNIQNIYEHIEELSPKVKNAFNAVKDKINLGIQLVTIKTDINLTYDIESLQLKDSVKWEAKELFDYYELNSLKKYLINVDDNPNPEKKKTLKYESIDYQEFISQAQKVLSLDLHDDKLELASRNSNNDIVHCIADLEECKSLLEDPNIDKISFNIKRIIRYLLEHNISLNGKILDIDLMQYLINPEQTKEINELSKSYLDIDLDNDLSTSEESSSLFNQDIKIKAFNVAYLMIAEKMEQSELFKNVSKLYWDIERPLIDVLAKMEYYGVKIDLSQIHKLTSSLKTELYEVEHRIKLLAENPKLNISSPKQIGELLFEKLKLNENAKKSAKGNWSTDESSLKFIIDKHPIVADILEFREIKKLVSTYIEPFITYVSPSSKKIHTCFNQSLTSTGRLSSSNPNLQNIPIRTERGKEIRRAFISSFPDGYILSADYSQIELRIMAALCKDEHLISAFQHNVDIHSATAAKIYNIDIKDVSPEQRRVAKTANFGIMYGISAFGLSQRLDISISEAKKIIDDYFKAFPSIQDFIEKCTKFAEEHLYVETLFGRRRYISGIQSKNKILKGMGERNAVNAPIQGTAADIIKLAMINIDKKISELGLKSKMVLQIHDELLFDCCKEEVDIIKDLVIKEMEGVISLSIPLTVECNYGKNWLEAH